MRSLGTSMNDYNPEATPDLTALKAYTRRKQEVAEALRTLLDVFRHQGDEAHAQQCRELLVKLAEDRFTLAVLGQFKRGKSSLMNSIIGRDLLPTGVLPLTSVVTILRFGSPERLVVERADSRFPETHPVSSLASLVTERGNPSNRRRLSAVYVELPVPLLRRGLEFVDTPGVGSAIEANTATTYAFLPSCDAAILVTSIDTPLTQTELELLRNIRSLVRHLFLVVNKTDLASPSEREEVLQFIATVLQEEVGSDEIRLFPVSAREGLQAKQRGDPVAYAHSGLQALEEALSRFLSVERGTALLVAVLDKALRIVAAASGPLELSQRAQQVSPERLQENLALFHERMKPMAARLAEVKAQLRDELASRAWEPLLQALDPFLEATANGLADEVETWLSDLRWRSAGAVMAEGATRLQHRFHEAVASWWAAQIDRTTPACEQILQSRESLLSEHLRTVAGLAAEIFQVPLAPEAASPPFSLRNLPVPPLPRLEAALPRRGAMAFWPAALARRPLRQWARESVAALQRAYRETIAQMLERRAGEIAEAFGGSLDRYREEIVAAVRRLPAAKSQGRTRDGNGSSSLSAYLEQLRQTEQRLVGLREQLLEPSGGPMAERREEEQEGDGREAAEPTELSIPAPAEAGEIELSKSLQTRGCPLCDHLVEWTLSFFARFQYQLVTDEQVRETFAQAGGFCAKHTWLLVTLSNPRGICLGHSSLTARLAGELARLARARPSDPPTVKGLVSTPDRCPVCLGASQVAAAYLDRLAAWLEQEEGRARYARSQGLCLPHLDLLVARARDPELARFLLQEAARHFEEVTEDMLNFALKHDALRRHLESDDERDAFYRAVTHLVGDQRLMAS